MSDNPRCIFGGHDEKLTSEHIWGDWITDYVPRTMNKHHYANILIPRPGEAEPPIVRIRAGDPLSSQVPVVCGPCNSGWMSRLQDEAKPFLIPLFEGKDCALDPSARTAISAWITMATMTSEYVSRDSTKIAISQGERDWLMNNRIPPEGWRIWIGRHHVKNWAGQWIHATFPFASSGMNIPNEHRLPNTQTTAIQIGALYIFVISSVFGVIPRIWDWSNAPRARRCLRQLWPHNNGTLIWPGLDMSDDDADTFARAFHRYNDDLAQRCGYQ
jgi:hypothetical protein